MAVVNAVEIARDYAGLAALALIALVAALLWTGAVGVTVGLAAALAGVSVGALVAILFYGLLGAALGLSGGVVALIGAGLVLIAGFLTAQYLGVRGFWVFCTLAFGALIGGGLVWLFSRGLSGPVGAWTPMIGAAVLLFVLFGALGAVKSGLASSPEERRIRFALADLAAPPAWFDCAYATLGGSAEAPGRCAFTPPEVEGLPSWARTPDLPRPTDVALDPSARAAVEAGDSPEASTPPEPSTPPAIQDLDAPDFDRVSALDATVTPGAPDAPDAPDAPADASEARQTASDDAARHAAAPSAPQDPAGLGAGAAPDTAAAIAAPTDATAIGVASDIAAAQNVDAVFEAPTAGEARRTEFVCFSALSASTERLCPDQTLSERDLEVAWRNADGEAVAAAGSISCYFDPNIALQATIVVNLSGALASELPNGVAGEGAVRRADAIYQMVTRMVGAARAGGEQNDELYLSLYLAGGSPLRAPWAEQAFAPGSVDRLFDVRSTTQTLALMRVLRSEVEALGPGALRGDLASALDAAVAEMPAAPFDAGERMLLLLVDSVDALELDEEAALKLGETAAAEGTPIFVVELGEDRGANGPLRLAERSGGAHFRARSVAELEEIAERLLRRSRSFCAVRVDAPAGFFERGSVELRLRRELEGACALEQIAVINCDGLSVSERILPSDL